MPFATLLALSSAGCSLSIDSMFDKSDKTETTGSIKRADEAMAMAELPPETDLIFARKAVNEMLSRGRQDASVPWENPVSGARGTVTAIASAYTIDKMPCRDFLASYVKASQESWLRGEACKQDNRWEVRAFKPWTRS